MEFKDSDIRGCHIGLGSGKPMDSIQAIEDFTGVKIERVAGEVLPCICATKDESLPDGIEIEWITPTNSELKPDGRKDETVSG